MLLPTELDGSTHVITVIRLLLSDYYYPGSDWNPDPKIRPVVHEKQLSGSQIRISIRITPNFELRLPMIITSLLTKFRQNPTSSLWEILLTNKQTNKQTNRQTDTRRWLQYPAFRGIIIMCINFLTIWCRRDRNSSQWTKVAGSKRPKTANDSKFSFLSVLLTTEIWFDFFGANYQCTPTYGKFRHHMCVLCAEKTHKLLCASENFKNGFIVAFGYDSSPKWFLLPTFWFPVPLQPSWKCFPSKSNAPTNKLWTKTRQRQK